MSDQKTFFDPDFCEHRCPICTRTRKGNRFAQFLHAIEMIVTFGGCPWGRARQKKYGVKPNESLPAKEMETTPMIPLEKILEEIHSSVARNVKEGFLEEDEIVEQVTEAFEDEYQRDDLETHVARLAATLCQEHRLAQETWPTPTDCDKLDAAFVQLEQQGIVARQNFACCQNCGHAEIGEEIEQASQEQEVQGYTFYHMQDTERAAEIGSLCLAYGSVTGKEEDSLAVGNAVAAAIRGVGLTVNWNGSINQRICIENLDWKRRRN